MQKESVSAHNRCLGHYVLRNNQLSEVQTAVRAKGILVSDKYYLDIDSLLLTPVSMQEALGYGRRLKLRLPTQKQMQMIAQNVNAINNSLLGIGRGDCLLFSNVCTEFWTRGQKVNPAQSERRKVLFLVSLD